MAPSTHTPPHTMSTESQPQDLSQITLASQVRFSDQKVLSLKSTSSLKHAIALLIENKIHSAPVYEYDQNNEPKKCLGLIDVLDILYYLIDIGEKSQMSKNFVMQGALEVETTANVLDVSQRNPYVPMKPHDSLAELMDHFAKGVHRVPILDSDDSSAHLVQYILSQSNAIQWCCNLDNGLFTSQKWFTDVLDTPVNQIQGLGSQRAQGKQLLTVRNDQKALDAFTLMRKNSLSAIPIVSKSNKIIANLSASDVCGFLGKDYHILGENVMDFLMQTQEQRVPDLIFCRPDHSLREVISRLLPAAVHRIYLVQEDDVTVEGVITLGDVFTYLNDLRLKSKQQ